MDPARTRKEEAVTIRVPVDLKRQIAEVARELGVSQSAVWKILIAHCIRPITQGNDLAETVRRITQEAARR